MINMKKILLGLGSIALALAIFTGGVYASQWLNFTGDEQITQSDKHVDEIMDILRQVNNDKLTAEDALAELKEMNPPGLVKQIKELEDLVAQLEGTIELRDNEIVGLEEALSNAGDPEYIAHLEAELERANNAVEQHNTVTNEAVEEARTYTDGE